MKIWLKKTDHQNMIPGDGESMVKKDPVCGMWVMSEVASQKGLKVEYMGADYYFCHESCKLKFSDNAKDYMKQNAQEKVGSRLLKQDKTDR